MNMKSTKSSQHLKPAAGSNQMAKAANKKRILARVQLDQWKSGDSRRMEWRIDQQHRSVGHRIKNYYIRLKSYHRKKLVSHHYNKNTGS